MAIVEITIKDRIATAPADALLVCNNPTDTIRFLFDAEWNAHSVKTARFSWEGKYVDRVFEGNEVQAPEISQTNYVFVGVFADNIASTPAKVRCRYSIKCMGGNVIPPSADVYEQIIELINKGSGVAGGEGATFFPVVSDDGTISWSNNGGFINPDPVNIKGPKGDDGIGFAKVELISRSTSSGAPNVTRVWMSNGKYWDITVNNGAKGNAGVPGKTPERGVDYWTPEDQEAIIQQVIAELGGVPVIGVVNDDNTISLRGTLADGAYTLKYVLDDGSAVTIGELVVGEAVEAIINWIPKSTDTDGTVYNGTGWKTGYRINSSGNVTAQSGYELTGFIPFTKGDVLRGNEGIIGLAAAGGDVSNTNYNVISFFNASKGFIANEGLGASSTADGLTINSDDSFMFDSGLNSKATDDVAYIRVTTVNITASSILTVNQEIE